MKICRIIYDWPPPWSGLAPHPYEITKAQLKKGHDVTVLCARWSKAGDIEKPKGLKIISVLREPLAGTISLTSSVAIFFKYLSWRKKNKDVDVIHCHGHFAIWIYAYRLFLQKYFPWAKELKTPLVAHFHNTVKGRWEKMLEDKKYIYPHSRLIAWPLGVKSDKWAIKTAAASIFVSKETADQAIKYYDIDTRRSFIVETGVNPKLFFRVGEEERNKSRKELGVDMYDKVILNYGMMVERKNIHVLVESLKYLPIQYKLMLVGEWPDKKYSQKIDQIIEENHLIDRVIKVGYTPYPQIPIALQNADLMVLPSSFEGLPKVVIESLCIGVPSLVSGFTVSQQINGLYYLKNIDAKTIASQINEIVKSNVKVDSAKIIHEYSWDRKALEIDGIYEFAKNNYLT